MEAQRCSSTTISSSQLGSRTRPTNSKHWLFDLNLSIEVKLATSEKVIVERRFMGYIWLIKMEIASEIVVGEKLLLILKSMASFLELISILKFHFYLS